MIERSGDRFSVAGPMVIASATELKTAGESAIAAGARFVDLARVTEADSAAVAVLLAWVRAAQELNQEISILGTPDNIRSLATLYGVAELLPLA